MNEVQARKQGLHFTGKYQSNRCNETGDIKKEAVELREEAKKMGFKIRIVIIHDAYDSSGISLYADNAYYDFLEAKSKATQNSYLLENESILLFSAQEKVNKALMDLNNLKNDILIAKSKINN